MSPNGAKLPNQKKNQGIGAMWKQPFLPLLLGFALFFYTTLAAPSKGKDAEWKKNCGYEACPEGNPDMINVHLVPHTHLDAGWLKTADQYYYGDKQEIQRAGVQYIFDSVISDLLNDPNRKFIFVESAFIWKWWQQQSDKLQQKVRRLVDTGQLEFIGGGWSMNDEAGPSYNAIIDNMSWGFRRLNDTFGNCGRPKVAWQIDPFGHSKEQASLFAQMYFDGLFVGRIDYEDKTTRQMNKTMEMLWKASNNIGKAGDLFTGILPNSYSPPDGFCFDLLCNDEPIMDDPRLKGYNVEKRVEGFLEEVYKEKKVYDTNHIVMTMGMDFHYQNANAWFKNLDKLIFHVNALQANGSNVNLFYSNPSCYLLSLNRAKSDWPTKTDDFFPYSSDPHAFWTGYFTSRPAFKKLMKDTTNFLQVVKQLSVLSNLPENEDSGLNALREALGEGLHHDAITGTAKEHVDRDYRETIATAFLKGEDVINEAYQKLIPRAEKPLPNQVFCQLNETRCDFINKRNAFTVTIYNPMSSKTSNYIQLPVSGSSYDVFDFEGKSVISQMSPNILSLKSEAKNILTLQVSLPALGYSTYFIKKASEKNKPIINIGEEISRMERKTRKLEANEDLILENEFLKVIVDGKSNLLKQVVNKIENITLNVAQSFYWYAGMAGNNTKFAFRASGAYIFRPNGTEPNSMGAKVKAKKIEGPLLSEIYQEFSPWLTQHIKLYKNAQHLEFDWIVGPIPVNDQIGKEIITRFDTDLKSNKRFYTDANGREIQERIRNFRQSYNANIEEPVSGNYYPVNSRIFIMDKRVQLNVLNDRTQGGSSLKDGSIELMVHRRLLHDDAFGVGEALNETGDNGLGLVIRGQHYMTVSSIPWGSIHHRLLGQQLLMQPTVSFGAYDGDEKSYINSFSTMFSGINSASIPKNVNILTLEPWKQGSVLLRLENFFEENEISNELSEKAVVSLSSLFASMKITSVDETTLGANQYLNEAQKLNWEASNSIYDMYDEEMNAREISDDWTVTLSPMQIRTFIINVE